MHDAWMYWPCLSISWELDRSRCAASRQNPSHRSSHRCGDPNPFDILDYIPKRIPYQRLPPRSRHRSLRSIAPHR
jgi:hypothetical protein